MIRFLSKITQPFVAAYDWLTDLIDYGDDGTLFNKQFRICEGIVFLFLFFYCRAYAGFGRFCLAVFLLYVSSVWTWCLASKMIWLVRLLFAPANALNSWCETRQYGYSKQSRKKTHRHVYGGGPKEVGLRYFIEEEKRAHFKPYDAKFYG